MTGTMIGICSAEQTICFTMTEFCPVWQVNVGTRTLICPPWQVNLVIRTLICPAILIFLRAMTLTVLSWQVNVGTKTLICPPWQMNLWIRGHICFARLFFLRAMTHGVTVSMSAFLACHQCYCAGSSLTWDLNLRAVVCGIFWSSWPGVFSGYPGFLPSFIGLMIQPTK